MRSSWQGSVRVAVVVMGALLSTGCVHVRQGIWNTLADATDVVRADVSVSFGTDMGAHVMITKWAQLKSYSYEGLYRCGLDARRLGLWEEARQDWWLGPKRSQEFGMNSNGVAMLTFGLPGWVMGHRGDVLGSMTETEDEIGVGAHLFVLGFRVGVRPVEFADMLANLAGQDLCGDNVLWPRLCLLHKWHKPKPTEAEPPAADAGEKAGPLGADESVAPAGSAPSME